jgi:hypothetical protein
MMFGGCGWLFMVAIAIIVADSHYGTLWYVLSERMGYGGLWIAINWYYVWTITMG